MTRLARRLLAIAGLAACSASRESPSGSPPAPAPPPASSPSLEQLLRRNLAAHHAMPWSARRRLWWSDFQAAPPRGGEESARKDSVQSRRTLGHEQTHCDIAEVYVRRMSRHFRAIRRRADGP
ncbi:MAG TPA: hypothetical protein VFU41_08735 [Gemmatimonadales bacterium]|nr:hypothetical protein [Gemmatimonadales bacterium]